jgi:hypothetical protein
MVAAAVIGGAVIGGVGASVAAGKSAGAENTATTAGINEQNAALSQQATLAAPYTQLGQANIPTYQNLLTGGGPGGPTPEQTLQSLPGYQTTLATGTEAAERSAGASGLNLSGNQVAGVEQFGSQLADSTYQTELQDLLQPIQIGQGAAAGQAANIGTAASNITGLISNQGNTTAAIDANEIAGITKAGSGAINQGLTYQTLNNLNNPNAGAPAGGWQTGGGPDSYAPADAGYSGTYQGALPTYGGP